MVWGWLKEELAFQALKQVLTSSPVLSKPDLAHLFTVHYAETEIGTICSQTFTVKLAALGIKLDSELKYNP